MSIRLRVAFVIALVILAIRTIGSVSDLGFVTEGLLDTMGN